MSMQWRNTLGASGLKNVVWRCRKDQSAVHATKGFAQWDATMVSRFHQSILKASLWRKGASQSPKCLPRLTLYL